MQTRDRVDVETTAHNEAEAQWEFLNDDLAIENCQHCDTNAPASEFKYEDICETCANKGQLIAVGLLEIEDKFYRV